MTVFALYNLKGGVGKTTSAVNLAYLAARKGYQTLLWDFDPQGAASFYFRIRPKIKGGSKRLVKNKPRLQQLVRGTDFEHLDLLPADFSYRSLDLRLDTVKHSKQHLRRLCKPLAGSYDYLFIDAPPGISLLSENIFRASDVVLMPLIPTTLSMRTYEQVRTFFKKKRLGLRLMPFFTMVDRRKRLHKDTCAAYLTGKNRFLESTIPYASAIERMGIERAPLLSYDRRSRAARAYIDLWDEVAEVARPSP